MKKICSLIAAVLCATLFYTGAYSQILLNPQENMKPDSLVRAGHLDNGLTYYIRYNANPEKRAEFYIATNTGAINETPEQRGLAHFLEHMCFNGNKDFPGNTMMSYLEKNGLIFGANINAATGVDQTVYTLNAIPTDRKALIDTALIILQNDAAFVTLDPAEIEKERGVIIEEWRGGNTASRRQQEALFKVLYKGSKYADCNIIGDDKAIQGFDPKELTNFYKTWYYPGNQAIIVVGDVDLDYIEGKIKEYFSIIPKKENAPVKEEMKLAQNAEPEYFTFTDPELNGCTVGLFIKQEPVPVEYRSTGMVFLRGLMIDLIDDMLEERLSDAYKKPGSSMLQAEGYCCTSGNKAADLGMFIAMSKEGEAPKALKELIGVLRQAQEFGFTEAEFNRAKATGLTRYQSQEDKAATRTNKALANQYVNHFLDNDPYSDPKYKNAVAKQYMELINVAMVNEAFKEMLTPNNRLIGYTAPKKEGVAELTKEELKAAYEEAMGEKLEALQTEEVATEFIDPQTIKSGKIKKEKRGFLGSTVLTLSNKIKVYLYPTDIKKDQITVNLVQKGGLSILPEELLPNFASGINDIYDSELGVGEFSKSQVDKMLSGKIASAFPYRSELLSGVSAYSNVKDLETAMQLLYLQYTQPRCNAEEFEQPLNTIKMVAGNIEKDPSFNFGVLCTGVENNNSPRAISFNNELLDKITAEGVSKTNDILFKDAAGSHVYIIGDFQMDVIKPLIAKYIASLPVKSRKPRQAVNHKLYPAEGVQNEVRSMKMENPTFYAKVLYSGEMQKTVERTIVLSAYNYIMNMRFIESLREEDGGTYSPAVSCYLTGEPYQRYGFYVQFNTQDEKSEALLNKVYSGVEKMAAEGPTDAEMTKAIEMLKKNISENKKYPSYWERLLQKYYEWGVDDEVTEDRINEYVTKENITKMAKKIAEDNNRATMVLKPEKN